MNFSESLLPLLSFLDKNHLLFGKMEDLILYIMESIPGLKFHPCDDVLLLRYLKPKIEGTQVKDSCVLPEIKVWKFDPWQLPTLFNELSVWKSQKGAREWIFFCPIKRKYLNSQRSERTTPSGHWKVTGIERPVKVEDGTSIGTKKTLVFYKGRFPKGKRTNWVMHEYHLNASCSRDGIFRDQLPYVACRLKLKEDKKGVNTSDYPTEDSNNNRPYSSDATDYTRVNKGDSSLFNTPNSVSPEYHLVTGDPYNAADQDEISLDDVNKGDLSLFNTPNSVSPEYHLVTGDPYNAADQDEIFLDDVNKGDLSLFNTPNSVSPEYHLVTGDPYNAADQDEISLDDVNKGESSLFNTPNSVSPEYHQVTGDPYYAADQDGISLDDVYALLPNLQHLDDGPLFKHNVRDNSNAINYGYMWPPSLSPWNTHDDNFGFGWDSSYSSNN